MSIQTRNKRKDWQPELGIKAHKVVCKRPSSGHSGTKCRALREQVTGTHYPYSRHRVPKVSDDFGHFSQVGGFDIMHDALWLFCDGFMMIWWYFYGNFMILLSYSWYFDDTFCKVIRKVSFLYIIIYQLFIPLLNPKDDTLRLFS